MNKPKIKIISFLLFFSNIFLPIIIYANSETTITNSDTLIESARVNATANRHTEAIKLFEKLKTKYPERSNEILFELADQYKFAGRFNEAVTMYNGIIKDRPQDPVPYSALAQVMAWDKKYKDALNEYDNALTLNSEYIPALLGKAETLSWMDKLDESYSLYQHILDKEPNNIYALIGQAQVLAWKGKLKEAISRYEEILKDNPKNLDAMEGLANALHYDDKDELAMEKINKALAIDGNRKGVLVLGDKIRNRCKPFMTTMNRYSRDNYNQTISTNGVRAGYHPNTSTSIQGIYERQIYRRKEHSTPKIVANRSGLGLNKRIFDRFNFNSYLYWVHFDKIDFDVFTTSTWLTYKASDELNLILGYDRWTYEDQEALLNKIFANSGSASINYRPNRFWFFNAKYQRSNISDGNKQNLVNARVEYRLFKEPHTRLYYNYYYFDMAEPDIWHGYWNTRSFQSQTLGIHCSEFPLTKKLSAEASIAGSYEFLNPGGSPNLGRSSHPAYFASCGLQYDITDTLKLMIRGEFSNARPDKNSEKGYIKKVFHLGLTYYFGVTPEAAPPEATRPSHPI